MRYTTTSLRYTPQEPRRELAPFGTLAEPIPDEVAQFDYFTIRVKPGRESITLRLNVARRQEQRETWRLNERIGRREG